MELDSRPVDKLKAPSDATPVPDTFAKGRAPNHLSWASRRGGNGTESAQRDKGTAPGRRDVVDSRRARLEMMTEWYSATQTVVEISEPRGLSPWLVVFCATEARRTTGPKPWLPDTELSS